MAIETKWPAVPPRQLTADGTEFGVVNVASTHGFKVKQRVVLGSSTQPSLPVQVKRVVSPTQMIVGPLVTKQGEQLLTGRQNISMYLVADSAYVFAEEQDKNRIKPEDILQAVYRQEPETIGVELDDEFGNAYGPENPLPVASSPAMWDEIDLTYNENQDLETATFTKPGTIVVLTLSYDANANLIKVVKS